MNYNDCISRGGGGGGIGVSVVGILKKTTNVKFGIAFIVVIVCSIVLFLVSYTNDTLRCFSFLSKTTTTTANITTSNKDMNNDQGGNIGKHNSMTIQKNTIRKPYFDRLVEDSYTSMFPIEPENYGNGTNIKQQKSKGGRKQFNLTQWKKLYKGTGKSGLLDADIVLIGELYYKSTSIFEYGFGESTAIASYVGVPRYVGVDSDFTWINSHRGKLSNEYRFYFADIGTKVNEWGYPNDTTVSKLIHQYQIAPLASEQRPFDIYMIDGRYRVACALICFLHASAYGGGGGNGGFGGVSGESGESTTGISKQNSPLVLVHDCHHEGYSPKNTPNFLRRSEYNVLNEVFTLVNHSKGYLCVYQRRPETTDDELYTLWLQHRDVVT